MPNFETDLQNALADAQRELFIEQIRLHPELTLSELLALAKGKFAALLDDVTVGHLLGSSSRPAPRKPGRPPSVARPTAKPVARHKPVAVATGGAVNTRTPEGRDAYDERVIDALRQLGGPANSEEIRPLAGGTPLQLRTALTRLANNGQVTWEGQARGTRYSLM